MPEQFTDTDSFCAFLGLSAEHAPYTLLRDSRFALRVPASFACRIARGDWYDPLLLQVLPRGRELDETPGFSPDAVGDRAARIAPGLLCKYEGRALLLASHACPMNCRFCLRRSYPYREEADPGTTAQNALWSALARRTDIQELILSGGDPLVPGPQFLGSLVDRFLATPPLSTLRVHTRMPVAQPERVTSEYLDALGRVRGNRRLIVVVHVNHARELGPDTVEALASLRRTGATLLHQGVLLRGINDSVDTLADLMLGLHRAAVLPYYLHQLDRVSGTAHFEVPVEEGTALMRELSRRLPGYLVPRYVREVAGAGSKMPL